MLIPETFSNSTTRTVNIPHFSMADIKGMGKKTYLHFEIPDSNYQGQSSLEEDSIVISSWGSIYLVIRGRYSFIGRIKNSLN